MANTSKLLLKGSAARIILLISRIAIGFFMLPFLVHALGDETYGLWVFVSSLFAFYSLLDFGMSGGMNRFLMRSIYENDDNSVNVSLSTSMVLVLCISVISIFASTGIYYFAPQIAPGENLIEPFQWLVIIMGIRFAVIPPLFLFYAILEAKYRYDLISSVQWASLVVRSLLVVLFVKLGFGILSVAIITAVVELVSSLIIAYSGSRYIASLSISLKKFDYQKFKTYLDFSKYAYFINISSRVNQSSDEIVIGTMIGATAVTQYTVALTLVQYFGGLIGSLIGVVNPLFNKYHKLEQWDNLREIYIVALEISCLFTILVGATIILIGDSFITVWMGESYSIVYIPLILLTVATIVNSAFSINSKVLLAIAKHKYLALVNIVAVVANVVISIVLVKEIGITGVAIGTLIPELVLSLWIIPLYTSKQLGLSYGRVMSIFIKFCLIGIVIYGIAAIFKNMLGQLNLFEMALISFIAGLFYFVLSFNHLLQKTTQGYVLKSLPNKVANVVQRFFIYKKISS